MSKYEITNGQYCEYLNSAYPAEIKVAGGIVYAASDDPNSYPYCEMYSSRLFGVLDFSGGVFIVPSKSGRNMLNDPVVMVTWYGAKAFCDYYGYRLPTETQWEYAARGGLARKRFPWGDTINHISTMTITT
jgi:formylglycine-generating enzyme required for sulfatase activity